MSGKRGRSWLELGGLFTSIMVNVSRLRAFSPIRFYADARPAYAISTRPIYRADTRARSEALQRPSHRAEQRVTFKAK